MKKYVSILFFSFLFSASLLAQDTTSQKELFITANAHYGFIVAHHQNMDYLIRQHIPAAELALTEQTKGKKRWERVYRNPQKGLGFYLVDLGNPQQLGYAAGLFPFINFPLNPGRKLKLFARVGDGVGIITKPYEKTKNHKNNINGSYINEFIYLRLYSVFQLSKNVRMETGIGLTHLSNGNWAVPNLGINLATLNMGFSFHKFDPKKSKQSEELLSEQIVSDTAIGNINRPYLTCIASAGLNEISYRNGKKYGTFALVLSGWKTVSEKSRFCAGLDFFYEISNLVKAEEKGTFDTNNKLNNIQAGIRLGYEMVVGKIGLPMEMGAYYFSKTTVNGPLYHRVGIRYYMNKHFILNYTLKTHWATAENIEFGLGYRF